MWLREELTRVNREKTPWLIVIMHVPIYNSNAAHYMEGESMRAVFESWFVRSKVDFIFAGHVHAYERSVCTFLFLYICTFLLHKRNSHKIILLKLHSIPRTFTYKVFIGKRSRGTTFLSRSLEIANWHAAPIVKF